MRTDDELITALKENGWNQRAAARSLKMNRSSVTERVQKMRKKGIEIPALTPCREQAPAPEGYLVKGTSTLLDSQGNTVVQWIKTRVDDDKFRAMVEAACRAAAGSVPPIGVIPLPRATAAHLCNLYTITDVHVGMLAWGKESGEPWDLLIAERCLTETFIAMMDAAPNAVQGVVNQLGDFLHFDSLKPLTPEHGHLLDADSRYQKIVEVAVRILIRLVNHALTKHERVQVYMHEGNHDPAGSVWLRVLFAQLYADNPRVTVGDSPLPYVAYQWGKTMLCFHHGHMAKNNSLPLLFAARFPQMWGETTKRYIHVGHRHHVDEKEHPGIKVIQHSTIAAADAYAARGGWLSERQATFMTYHLESGEIARGIFIPQE
jgi:biotin operon repressor